MILIFFLITLQGLVFPKCKVFAFIEIIAMTLFYGGYCGIIDLGNYKWQYENNWMTDIFLQKGYCLMNIFFHKLGASFQLYHLTITMISFLLLFYIALNLTTQISYVMCMIPIFVYIENGWQLKTMMATCLIIVALYYFYKKIYKRINNQNKIKNSIIYLLLIFLASQFHFLAIFFVSFLFIDFIKGKLLRVIILDICISGGIRIIVFKASNYIPMLTTYLSPISFTSFGVTIIWQLLGYLILFFNVKDDNLLRQDKMYCFVKDGSLLLMLLFPLYYYTVVAMRIYRIWIIIMIIYATRLTRRRHFVFSKRRIIFDLYILGSTFFWYGILFLLQGKEPLFFELINNNYYI